MTKKNIVGRLNDGLVSLMTSLGEKIGAVRYSSSKPDVPDKELLAMYKKSWVVKKYINKTADDMLKLPRKFSGDVDTGCGAGIYCCHRIDIVHPGVKAGGFIIR